MTTPTDEVFGPGYEPVIQGPDETPTKAYQAGHERGQSSGTWVIDGNTSEDHARRLLKGIEDGDPEILDMAPNPLSGEWAGESIPELSNQYEIDLTDDENATEFEQGFNDGFWSEVETSTRKATGA